MFRKDPVSNYFSGSGDAIIVAFFFIIFITNHRNHRHHRRSRQALRHFLLQILRLLAPPLPVVLPLPGCLVPASQPWVPNPGWCSQPLFSEHYSVAGTMVPRTLREHGGNKAGQCPKTPPSLYWLRPESIVLLGKKPTRTNKPT